MHATLFCFSLVWLWSQFFVDSCDLFILMFQRSWTGTGAILCIKSQQSLTNPNGVHVASWDVDLIYGCRNWRSAESGDLTSAWWRVQPRLLTQKRGQFPFYYDHLGRSNQTMYFLKHNYPQLNGYHQLQVDDAFIGEYIAMHGRWRHNGRRMQTKYDPVKHPREEKRSSEHISRRFESVNGFITSLCMSRKLSEVCIFNLYSEIMTIQSGNPRGDRDGIKFA